MDPLAAAAHACPLPDEMRPTFVPCKCPPLNKAKGSTVSVPIVPCLSAPTTSASHRFRGPSPVQETNNKEWASKQKEGTRTVRYLQCDFELDDACVPSRGLPISSLHLFHPVRPSILDHKFHRTTTEACGHQGRWSGDKIEKTR